MIPVFRPSYDHREVDAVREVLESGWTGLGPKVEEFEHEFAAYIGTKHAIATNSGTSALELAIMATMQDTMRPVIASPLTFVSANNAIFRCGLVPIWCDVDRHSLNMDISTLPESISNRAQTIICTHFGGHACDMERILAVAHDNGLSVIEDAAHACGGEYQGKKLGSLGDCGCFSFHAVKNLSCGDGGMVTTNSDVIANKIRNLRWCGIDRTTWQRKTEHRYSWDYDVPKIGLKAHMNDITAAIGLVQLSKLDEQNRKRRELSSRYADAFNPGHHAISPIISYPLERHGKSSWHNYVIQTENRDALHEHMEKDGIASSVHYRPNHHYAPYTHVKGVVPIVDFVWKRILTIPLYPDMTMEDQDKVIDSTKTFFR